MNSFYRQGEIISIEGNRCKIQLSLSGFCSGKHQCTIAAFGKGISPEMTTITVQNNIHAERGEKVMVEIVSPGFYRSLLFVLILPLITLLLGCVLGAQLAFWTGNTQRSDLYAGICGVIFLSWSLLISRSVNRHIQPKYIIHNRVNPLSNCEGCLARKR